MKLSKSKHSASADVKVRIAAKQSHGSLGSCTSSGLKRSAEELLRISGLLLGRHVPSPACEWS